MFNRYMNAEDFDGLLKQAPDGDSGQNAGEAQSFESVSGADKQNEQPKKPLKGLFGGKLSLPEFDPDTVLLLILVYFLISDEKSKDGEDEKHEPSKNITETLLIIGALLLLGL